MIHTPGLGCPIGFGDEPVQHEFLEHGAAPAGDHAQAAVLVGAFESLPAFIGAPLSVRDHLRPGPLRREGAIGRVVGAGRDLAAVNAELGGHPSLGDRRVIVVTEVEGIGANNGVAECRHSECCRLTFKLHSPEIHIRANSKQLRAFAQPSWSSGWCPRNGPTLLFGRTVVTAWVLHVAIAPAHYYLAICRRDLQR